MATEPTLIRRYTPPTCSLEIVAQQSPLSRWMGKVALKDLRFKLSFDDPRISDDDWVVLRGDRPQLEALNQTVSDYVQSFLTQASPLATIEQDIAAQTAVAATELAAAPANPAGIMLQPKGLLSHSLSLGSLANENSGDRLTLTSTQLADLSTALDEYSAEATTLPNLDQKVAWLPNTSKWSSPNWAGLAAGILVTVGLGASLVNSLSNRSTPQTASQASSSDQRLAIQPPANPSPTPNPFSTLPPLAPLPPGATLPKPGATPLPTQIASAKLPTPSGDQKIDTVQAPVIANSQGGQAGFNTMPVPQPGAAANSTAKSTQPNTPAIVDKIGGTGAVDPEPILAEQKAARAAANAKLERSAAPAAAIAPPAPAPAVTANSQVATNDQAAAVQSYFQQRWKPQKGLERGLEYDLTLDANGALQDVVPKGPTSTEQQSQAGIPAIGTPIAPAAPNGKATTLRLLLEQTGGVQVVP
jgi:Domain of unknown function (DUF4335)